MTDKELIRTVKGFTKGILSGKGNNSMCFAVCCPLQGYLSICGLNTDLIECDIIAGGNTYQHYYLLLPDGRIIDPTASQFNQLTGDTLPDIYIGAKPEHYQPITIKATEI